MIKQFKEGLKPIIPHRVMNQYKRFKWEQNVKKRLQEWEENGYPIPPPHEYKQKVIADYQKKFGIHVLVETGTYHGHMVLAQIYRFNKIISVELSDELYKAAAEMFRNYPHITILHGDSGKLLPGIVKEIHEPAIFWLDGHYSAGVTAKGEKESPVLEEIDAIFNGKNLPHIILIDDARHFTGKGDYPAYEELKKFILDKNSMCRVECHHDIIRCTVDP